MHTSVTVGSLYLCWKEGPYVPGRRRTMWAVAEAVAEAVEEAVEDEAVEELRRWRRRWRRRRWGRRWRWEASSVLEEGVALVRDGVDLLDQVERLELAERVKHLTHVTRRQVVRQPAWGVGARARSSTSGGAPRPVSERAEPEAPPTEAGR